MTDLCTFHRRSFRDTAQFLAKLAWARSESGDSNGLAANLIILVAFALAAIAPAEASNVRITGYNAYVYSGQRAVLDVVQITNYDASGVSADIRLELWATSEPYPSTPSTGYKLAQYSLGQLSAGGFFSYVDSGWIPYSPPPNGAWYVALILTESAAGATDDGYVARDWRNFSNQIIVGPQAPTVTPAAGVWWDPNQSGSGFGLQYKNGVLIVQMYSYLAGGAAQWYLASGQVIGNVFTATLDKYVGGQCVSCPYKDPGGPVGNDGQITITFTSSTAATVSLSGGTQFQIQPFFPP